MVSNPFRGALQGVRGSSWAEEAARSSLRAAEAKFYPEPREPMLRVELGGQRTLGAFDTATVSMALQTATAKLGHLILDPGHERTQSRKSDREDALLIPKMQLGRSLFFGFAASGPNTETSLFPDLPATPSLSQAAALELCSILPSSGEDDAALDALISQRVTVRSAINDIVEAVNETATSLHLELSVIGHESVHSEVSVDQAAVLRDTLKETRTDRRSEEMVGRLDGVRTRRRIFYLELETGEEIHGAIGPDSVLMAKIRESLDRTVVAIVESERVETIAGHRGRPTYRLIGLEPVKGLFD